MANLAFCDYHNMVDILEKTEHNTDFHQIVDFLDASHIRYALTISPTVYVSHIRQFWSTARIETTDQETKIIAIVDGKSRSISESSLRRHLKLNDKERISSLPDAELFENLSLMGYNILPNQRLSEQVARDSEKARIHVEELKMMIEGLNRSNEVIAKHLSEYEQAEADLSVREKIELISELVTYQDHRAKILKYQAQQSKPLSKMEQREFYMCVLRSHAGWKTKHFRGMTLEQIKEKCVPVWKQWEDFIPMSSKEECERVKRPGLKLDQGS
nr:hypothetical protein [Tanacetum cinerariifolium]